MPHSLFKINLCVPNMLLNLLVIALSFNLMIHASPYISLSHGSGSDSRGRNNTTLHPLTFVDIRCYHLLPETVDLHDCQPLFDRLFADGNVYQKQRMWNGWTFKSGYSRCIIRIETPVQSERRVGVSLSIAEIVTFAIDVLKTCRASKSGGFYVFEGSWRVGVSRNVIKSGLLLH